MTKFLRNLESIATKALRTSNYFLNKLPLLGASIAISLSLALKPIIILLPLIFIFKWRFKLAFILGLLVVIALNTLQEQKLANINYNQRSLTINVLTRPEDKSFNQEAVVYIPEYDLKALAKFPKFSLIEEGLVLLVEAQVEKHNNPIYSRGYKLILITRSIKVIENNKNLSSSIYYHVTRNFRKMMHEPEASLALGLITGETKYFSKEQEEVFRRAGISHIVAVSGSNVILIMSLLATILIKLPRNLKILANIVIAWVYLGVVGIDNYPALRAIVFISLVNVAELFNRKPSYKLTVLLGLIFLLIYEPFLIFNISLQLSLASLGAINILLDSSKLNNHLENFLTSVVTYLTTAPILFFNFGSVSLAGLISNIFVLPLVSIATIYQLFLIALSFLGNDLLTLFYYPLYLVLKLILTLGQAFGSIPFLQVNSLNSFLLTYIAIFIFYLLIKKGINRHG